MRTGGAILLLLSIISVAADGGIRSPGKYNGIVIFDRWGGCYLYSGAYLMAISEKVKESLRAFQDKAVLIDAQEVFQPINSGDGLITKLKVLGPAEELSSAPSAGTPNLDGLRLTVVPDFRSADPDELIVQVRNDSPLDRTVEMNALAPTIFSKHQGLECFEPTDGPSYAAVTRYDMGFLYKNSFRGSCLVNGKGRTVKLSLVPGFGVSPRIMLGPGQEIQIPLLFQLSPGEYEFLAGYGGGVHAARSLASNRFGFDVDQAGKAHLAGGAAVPAGAFPSRRVATVCGKVTRDDGKPAAGAQVILWPFPLPKERAWAATEVVADVGGGFRMESVPEGKYVLAAVNSDQDGVLAGALGNIRAADAPALTVDEVVAGCPYSFVIHRMPGYSLLGRTTPDDSTSLEPRTVHMILTRGDAYPFEETAVVHPDGRFEFHDMPAGNYQFFAGWTGGSFEVTSNTTDMNLRIKWPPAGSEVGVARFSGAARLRLAEQSTISTLKNLHFAQSSYAEDYKSGFVPSLNVLGPPPEWYRPTADSAGLVDERKAGRLPGDNGTQFAADGYRVTYLPGPPDAKGRITTYTLSARPLELGKTGIRSFLLDEHGIIHATSAPRPATTKDAVLKD